MGLWLGHLAGDQGPGFNPDSVLLSSERFPCHPLSCLFGRPRGGGEGCALSRGVVAVPGAWGCGAAGGVRLSHPPAGGHKPLLGTEQEAEEHQEFPAGLAGSADLWTSLREKLGKGRTCIPQAPRGVWGTSTGTGRYLTSLFQPYCLFLYFLISLFSSAL